jgi:hypothetical protein
VTGAFLDARRLAMMSTLGAAVPLSPAAALRVSWDQLSTPPPPPPSQAILMSIVADCQTKKKRAQHKPSCMGALQRWGVYARVHSTRRNSRPTWTLRPSKMALESAQRDAPSWLGGAVQGSPLTASAGPELQTLFHKLNIVLKDDFFAGGATQKLDRGLTGRVAHLARGRAAPSVPPTSRSTTRLKTRPFWR